MFFKWLNSAWLPTHPLLSDSVFIKWASTEETRSSMLVHCPSDVIQLTAEENLTVSIQRDYLKTVQKGRDLKTPNHLWFAFVC